MNDVPVCTPRSLPPELIVPAARAAVNQNPVNAPERTWLARVLDMARPTPERIALLTSRYWGAGGVHLGVAFLDTQDSSLIGRILSHMNAWGQFGNVLFSQASRGNAQVRIARQPGGGYWSYLGTDILHIPSSEPTMNLDSFSMQTPESEYKRVVRHETGHTLGFPHEHLRRQLVARIDPAKAIQYFAAADGWSADMTTAQVLTPLEESTLTATPDADQLSIMCYQLPGSITTDGQPIIGGVDIDRQDGAFAAQVYPLPTQPPGPTKPPESDCRGELHTAALAAINAAASHPLSLWALQTATPLILKQLPGTEADHDSHPSPSPEAGEPMAGTPTPPPAPRPTPKPPTPKPPTPTLPTSTPTQATLPPGLAEHLQARGLLGNIDWGTIAGVLQAVSAWFATFAAGNTPPASPK